MKSIEFFLKFVFNVDVWLIGTSQGDCDLIGLAFGTLYLEGFGQFQGEDGVLRTRLLVALHDLADLSDTLRL